jgi:hypothetical protein
LLFSNLKHILLISKKVAAEQPGINGGDLSRPAQSLLPDVAVQQLKAQLAILADQQEGCCRAATHQWLLLSNLNDF